MVEFNRPDLRERVRIGLRIAEQFGLDVSETIQLTVPVGDMVTPNLFTGYPKGAWGRVSQNPPGVGDISQCIIQSVPDRGIVYHVTGVWITETTVTGNIRLNVGNSDISGSTAFLLGTQKAYTDTRDRGTPDCNIATSGPLVANMDGDTVQVYGTDGPGWTGFIPLDVVLGEQGFLLIKNDVENEILDVSWRWTEYLLEDR